MSADPGDPARGLTAGELALAVQELHQRLAGWTVLDAVLLQPGDDLLLVLQGPAQKEFVHVALGSRRARLGTTARRFGRHERQTGPKAAAVQAALSGRVLSAVTVPAPGERRARLQFADGLRFEVELFSARGLWALVDGAGLVLELSRPVATAVRTLAPGQPYAPPPTPAPATGGATATVAPEPPLRFAPPVLAAIDAHFAPLDQAAAVAADRDLLRLAAARASQRLQQKIDGLERQLADADRSDALRQEADLLLAYAHRLPRGAASVTVPDPFTNAPRTIELDPALPVLAQAQARYERARRLDASVQTSRERLAAAEREAAALAPIAAQLAAAAPLAADELGALRTQLQDLGALPRPKAPGRAQPKQDRRVQGENLRRFRSAEGYEILIGRDHEQNDRLTLRIANGNDLWLHVGSGRPGSHVVIRLPKGKTASLETLLDAAALAVHFSKARGERSVDVIYTLAKHIRKPKGLPPGAVVPSQQKSLRVLLDEARLRRLLDSAGETG